MIVGILGPGGCGGTFLDWSLHYLSGNNNNWVIECEIQNRKNITTQYQQDITNNPLIKNTAHNHEKTHPNTESLPGVIDIFKSLSPVALHTFYYVDSMLPLQTATTYNTIIKNNPDLLFITYKFDKTDVDKIFCWQIEKNPNYLNRFNNTISSVNMLELPVWEQREILSLYYPKCIQGQICNEIMLDHTNAIVVEFNEIVNSGDDQIENIFNFLKIKIDKTRWPLWKEIYKVWQHGNNLDFYQDLDKIIDCILSNTKFDLTQYNMTFAKEVVISNRLLYNHNKTLKSLNISRIPLNCQDWHNILEENTYHDLSN